MYLVHVSLRQKSEGERSNASTLAVTQVLVVRWANSR